MQHSETGKLTLGRAAELCGRSLSDFIQILIDHNIHWAYTKNRRINSRYHN
ncbi:UPF0175 family protein [Neobacillus bataviensis]|uniref:UPF0175 family protein n=1 Tax=Neobacillus bataviensis TaxID=220685 RepID=UPI000A017F4F|nr:UPF0175 family protein [Neobacillus bataviensis]